MNKTQKELIKQANIALAKNLMPNLSVKERHEVQTIFIKVISEYEDMVAEAENIPNLCPFGCECGDLYPSICPNFKDEYEDE